ncbi:MAG: hypothetical protein JNJ41_02045 [Bacteroidia bacterium]|nr:hypothetical protein [Bacteroidia bacterium]
MLKHPKIKSVQPAGQCSFTNHVLVNNMQLSPYAFQRYLRKASLYLKPNPSLKIYQLPCNCYVWVYASGIRQLSALPF